MLTGESARIVNRIRRRLARIVGDLEHCGVWRAQSRVARWVTQDERCLLRPFCVVVFADENRNNFLSVAWLEGQVGDDEGEVTFLFSRAVATGHVNRGPIGCNAQARDYHIRLRAIFRSSINRLTKLES